jgi:hypothetical protein
MPVLVESISLNFGEFLQEIKNIAGNKSDRRNNFLIL